MVVGIPKEVKDQEYRVAITPAGVDMLCAAGHRILIQEGAGLGSSISDEAFAGSGADIVAHDEVFAQADMIVKVKEPQPAEYELLQDGQVLFTFFHFASNQDLTEAMLRRGVVCIAYETIQTDDGSLPILAPMSDVAGRVAMSAAIKYLERPMGGKGKLLSGIPGVLPGKVVILGGGIAGTSAGRIAAGLGADVFILDTNLQRLRFLFDTCSPNVHTLASNPHTIREILPSADVIIGAVLIPGARAPHLITREMLRNVEAGSIVADISIDQGGCVETSRPTTHSEPTYVLDGIVHYCVTNMPSAVSHTSTYGLANAAMPYTIELAEKGWRKAAGENAALRCGLNASGGKLHNANVAAAFGWEAEPAPV